MCLVLTPRPCPGARLFCGPRLEIGPWAGPCPRWWVISLRQDGRPRASGDLGGATRVRLLHTPLPALCCALGSARTGDAGAGEVAAPCPSGLRTSRQAGSWGGRGQVTGKAQLPRSGGARSTCEEAASCETGPRLTVTGVAGGGGRCVQTPGGRCSGRGRRGRCPLPQDRGSH